MTKENTFYFSHDFNARTDDKIKSLLMKWGMAGYGVYWSIIEDLYQNANALRNDSERIAFDLRVAENMVESIINDFDLFVLDGDFFGSVSVKRRMEERKQKSVKARESAFKRWGGTTNNANALRSECEPNAIKERKGKEIKVKEINNNIILFEKNHELIDFINESCPRVRNMKKPFDNDSAQKICDEFGMDSVKAILVDMENYVPLHKKSIDANLTARKWIKNNQARTNANQITPARQGIGNQKKSFDDTIRDWVGNG